MISGNDHDVTEDGFPDGGRDLAVASDDTAEAERPRRSQIHGTPPSWSLPALPPERQAQVRSLVSRAGQGAGRFTSLGWPGLLVVAGVVVLLVALPFVLDDDTHDLTGTIETPTSGNAEDGFCDATGDYDAVGEGAQVTVRGADGQLLGLGTLSAGAPVGGELDRGCAFAFEVPGLPRSAFYTISAGSGAGGGMHFAHDDLDEAGWHANVTLKR